VRLRAGLLTVAYVILVAIVTFGAFWLDWQFDRIHENDCAIARATSVLVAADLAESGRAESEDLLREAQRMIDETC
jgi:hypothetical protein